MAHSSSIKRAQAIKLCELCQDGGIKWRCIECDKCMCEKCKFTHTRVPVTAKHEIVTIATPLQDMPRKIIMDNIPCKDHTTTMACLFCQTCDCLVCAECVSTDHSKHQFVPLQTSVDRKLDQLKSLQTNIIENLKYCDTKNKEIQNINSKYKSIFEESIEKIQQKERKLKEEIGKYSTILQRKVEHERSKAEDAVSKVEKHIDQIRQALEKSRDEIENALKSTQGAVIFETKPSIQTPDISFDSLPKEVELFLPKTEQTTEIQQLFGSLKNTEFAISKEQLDFQVLRTFTTDQPLISQLITQTENSAWISNFRKEMIRKIDIAGDKVIISKEVSSQISDMDFTANNDILFSDYKSSDVKRMSQSGKIKPFLSVKPLLPKGIHVTRNNEVLVGVRESCTGSIYEITEKSQRAVMVFDMKGQRKHSYQYDKNGQRLFNVPYRIKTKLNHDILVIDCTSDDTGRVVCLDREGSVKFIYKGHQKINAAKELDPRDLAITSGGYVIVSDYFGPALHVLSRKGDLLFCKVTEDLGILYPITIDIDQKGQLWVGCGTGGKQTGAKIHVVKYLC